jgi:phosphate transport system permease protein
LSLLPAVLVISVICIPYLTKATETSLDQAPGSCRDGAEALARPVSWTLRKIVVKSAALLLFVLVLIVIIAGRVVVAISRRHAE